MRSKSTAGIAVAVPLAAVLAMLALSGCDAAPVVRDTQNDQVEVQANGANLSQAQAKAQEACNRRNGTAKLENYRCEDRYCIQGTYFFSCVRQAK